jgi:hypothetical protein
MAAQKQKRELEIGQQSARMVIADQTKYFETHLKLPTTVLPPASIQDPAERQTYEASLAAMGAIERNGNLPYEEQIAKLQKLQPEIGTGQEPGVYAKQQAIYTNAIAIANRIEAERRADPGRSAYSQGFSTDSPIVPIKDFSDPAKFAEESKVRGPQMDAFNSHFKTGKGDQLMNDEAANLKSLLNNMPAKDLATWIDTYANGVNDPKRVAQVFSQVAKGDASLIAAAIIAAPNLASYQKKADDMNAILFGRSIIKMNQKGEDNEDVKGVKGLVVPSADEVAKQIASYAGKINLLPDQYAAYTEAVRAHFVGASVGQSITNNDFKDEKNGEANISRLQKSIDAVMGKPTQAGNSSVIRPYGMDENSFINAVQSEVSQAFNDKYRYGEYSLRSMSDGRYIVSIGGSDRAVIDPVNAHIMGVADKQFKAQSSSGAAIKTLQTTPETPTLSKQLAGSWSAGGSAPSIYTDLR